MVLYFLSSFVTRLARIETDTTFSNLLNGSRTMRAVRRTRLLARVFLCAYALDDRHADAADIRYHIQLCVWELACYYWLLINWITRVWPVGKRINDHMLPLLPPHRLCANYAAVFQLMQLIGNNCMRFVLKNACVIPARTARQFELCQLNRTANDVLRKAMHVICTSTPQAAQCAH